MQSLILKILALLLTVFLVVNLANTMIVCKAEIYGELIPHEDPARAREETDVLTLLMLYLYSLSLTSTENYEDAGEVLKQLKLFKVTEELKYVVDRFNEILVETHEYLNNTKEYINLAKYLNITSEFDKVVYAIHNAAFYLVKANISYRDLKTSYSRLVLAFKRKVPKEGLAKFYQLLEANNIYLEKIGELIEKYHEEILKLRMKLSEVLPETKGLYETKIVIEVKPEVVMIGDNITIHGKLSTLNDEQLPWRKVFLNIVFKRKTLFNTTLTTDVHGIFKCNYTVPYIYDKDIIMEGLSVIVSYLPEGEDLELYKPCSNITTVIALFNETRIHVSGPSIAYPGLKIKLNISVNPPPTENKPRIVEVLIDGKLQETFEMSSNETMYELKIPENISIGTHILTFKVKPLETFSPAIGGYGILVTYIPVKLDLSITKISYYPFSKIRIWGKIFIINGTFLQGKEVLVSVNGKKFNLNTDPHGEFSLEIDPTFTITFQELTVNIEFKPKEPWFPKIVRKEKVRVISLIPLIFALSSLFSYMYTPPKEVKISLSRILNLFRRRRRAVRKAERKPSTSYSKLGETYVKKPTIYSIKVTLTDVTKLYVEAVKLISERTTPPKPYETMREYWREVRNRVPGHVAYAFKELTILAEKAIYFKPEFTSKEQTIARKCYEEILKWCVSWGK